MQVTLNDKIIDVIIIYKNNKNIYMRVKEDLKLYVTCNKYVSLKEIQKIIDNNQNSIIKMYDHIEKQKLLDESFYYLGKKYTVIYQDDIRDVIFEDEFIWAKDEKMLTKFLNNKCKEVFSQRINTIKTSFNYLPPFKLKIQNMKTRWGVCNRSNNTVTLNSQLLKKDLTLLDYVIIHEFCHFKHPNHSALFWQEVAKYYPNYKLARKKLKEV